MILLSGGQGQNIQQQRKLCQYSVLARYHTWFGENTVSNDFHRIRIARTLKKALTKKIKTLWGKKEKGGKKSIEGFPLDQMVIQCRQEADREMPEHNITKSSYGEQYHQQQKCNHIIEKAVGKYIFAISFFQCDNIFTVAVSHWESHN